jgi:hypothetical protein
MGGPVDIPGDQLRTIVERIEHIEQEISELNEGKKEIYQEAKSNGFGNVAPCGYADFSSGSWPIRHDPHAISVYGYTSEPAPPTGP